MKRLFSLVCILGICITTMGGCRFNNQSNSDHSSDVSISDINDTTQTGDSINSPAKNNSQDESPSVPTANEEMQGVWLSYVELNTMFSGKGEADAKAAINSAMDNIKSYGMNTVIFHVRANSDAYYKSSIFDPAASVKSLISGGFDPLAYAIESAHSRGLKLQAWINPYRVGTKSSYAKSSNIFSVSDRYYYNPASADVQSLILRGVAEVVSNYEVDGVQYDDYFYPSDKTVIPPSSPASFENEEYSKYTKQGGTLSIDNWRRTNVDALIASTYQKVHARSGCVFGVSPRSSVTDCYSLLYADVEEWISHSGYVDYICPQIYYGFENSASPFDKTLAAWVVMKRSQSVKLYVGLGLYKTGWKMDTYAGNGKEEWSKHEDIIKRSVQLIRTQKACSGMMFYSYSSFDANIREKEYLENIAKKEIENLLSVM